MKYNGKHQQKKNLKKLNYGSGVEYTPKAVETARQIDANKAGVDKIILFIYNASCIYKRRHKGVHYKALTIVEVKNIDFVDALICAKSRLQGYGKLNFDTDVEK
ncbi:MAG: hypothetical protein U9R26_06490 [Campylobacterota bacterium]|nr:hypothetical protein [Campylobacterota bacterium]